MRGFLRPLAWWRLLGPDLSPRFPPGQEHPWRLAGRLVFVGDREFVVREAGEAEAPALLLIHGLNGSSLAEWYEVGPRLGGPFRLILIDHRNHGVSASSRDRYEIEEAADDIAGVLAAIGVSPLAVAGYSMGGVIAQALVHRHPGLVERMVLIGTFTHHPQPLKAVRQAFAYLTRTWERATGWGTPDVRTWYLIKSGAVDRRHQRWLWEETHRRDPGTGYQASSALFRFDSRPYVASLTIPALVVIPSRDQLVPPVWQYELAASLPNAQILELYGAKHEAPWTHPEVIAKGMLDFLNQ